MQTSEPPIQFKTPSSFVKPMGSSSTLVTTRHPFSRAEQYNICSTQNSSEEKLSAKPKTVRWARKPAGFQSANTSRMDSSSKWNDIHPLCPVGYRDSNVSPSVSQITMSRSTPHSEYDPGLGTTEYGTDMGDYWSIHPNGSVLGNWVGQPVEEQAHSVSVDRHPKYDSQAASPRIPQKDNRKQTKTLKKQDSKTKQQTKMLRTQGRCFTLDSSTVKSPLCKEYQPSEHIIENSPETESLIQALELLCVSVEENNRSYELELRELDPSMTLRRRFLGGTISDNSQHRTSLLTSRTVRTGGQRHDQLRRAAGHRRSEDSGQNRTDKVAVEVRVVFLKIGEIDTLKELYYADAFIQAKWREPKLDGRVTEELTITELEQYWNPLLFIDNILSETKETQWLVAQENEAGEVCLVERRRIKGVFLETLELNDFPLDVQDLTITVTTERPDTEVDIIPDQNEMSAINIQTFVDQQEWKLHEHVEITKRIIKQEYSSSMKSHPCLSVTCRAARRPGYFYWNVFLIMFMISGLSFATFAVSPDKAELRLRLSFTLILTSVTFKYVITQSLPKISYLTYMDKYVLMSLAILCIISIWHAVVTLLDPQHIAIRNGQSGELSDTFDFTTPKIPTQFAHNASR
ncbi:gamma-aminobutyric acid receptor subunit gamma-3, partial [Clonorchis sinensis]